MDTNGDKRKSAIGRKYFWSCPVQADSRHTPDHMPRGGQTALGWARTPQSGQCADACRVVYLTLTTLSTDMAIWIRHNS